MHVQAQQSRVSRDHLAATDLLGQLRCNLREEDQALLHLSNHWYCQVRCLARPGCIQGPHAAAVPSWHPRVGSTHLCHLSCRC